MLSGKMSKGGGGEGKILISSAPPSTPPGIESLIYLAFCSKITPALQAKIGVEMKL